MPDNIPEPEATCDGGDLDCGSGLLLIIRNAMAPLAAGAVLEVRSREISVKEDLPAWCRLVGHDLVGTRQGVAGSTNYFIRKKAADGVLRQDLQQAQKHVWRARVRGKGGMEAQVFVRNHSFAAGQPLSFDTADKAVSAAEYLLGALGSCIAVGLQWRASQRGIRVNNLEISLQAKAENVLVYLGVESAGNPGLAEVEAVIYVDCDAGQEALDELVRETMERSPVTQTLQRAVAIKAQTRRA
ncbi:MAG TPA: OsmC family protein [Methylomirabilota bacterium]|nr:OsmC family protein [Methylomirabilota bacterium]